MELRETTRRKYEALRTYINGLGSLAVGYSGGVDSTFLITVAEDVLGGNALAITALDASVPRREYEATETYCREKGIRHIFTKIHPGEAEGYRHNAKNRCYYCKRCTFTAVWKLARENGIRYIADGSNMDDLGDYRPGLQAAAELGVVSPLREADMHKDEIREISRYLDIPTWNKPASACLASRIAYGEEITDEKLSRIDQAEQFLLDLGFRLVRVRVHGDLARIEVGADEIPRLAADKTRQAVFRYLRGLGYTYVTIDMNGYSRGSMNQELETV